MTMLEAANTMKAFAETAIDLKRAWDVYCEKFDKMRLSVCAEEETLHLTISGGGISNDASAEFKGTTSKVGRDAKGPLLRPLWEYEILVTQKNSWTLGEDQLSISLIVTHLAEPHGDGKVLIPLKTSFAARADNSHRTLKSGESNLYDLALNESKLTNHKKFAAHGEHFDVVTKEKFTAVILSTNNNDDFDHFSYDLFIEHKHAKPTVEEQ